MEQNSTILIVDDEPTIQRTLEALLMNENYNLAFASSGTEALQKAAELMPDLILLDVMMPDIDGLEVCRRLRADAVLADVPVIMITALADRNARIQGIEAGADDFVAKPFDLGELRARVRTITRLNRYRHLLAERAKIEQAKQEWESTVDSLFQLVCLLDNQGGILRANRTVERWHLGKIREIRGRKLHDLLHPGCANPTCYLAAFWPSTKEELNQHRTVECEAEDQILKRYLHIQAQLISTHTGWKGDATSFAVVILDDITVRKKAEKVLQKAHDELEQRVEERTTELSEANANLIEQIAERQRAEEALKERMRLLTLSTDVGVALTQSDTLAEMLDRCVKAMVRRLNATFARIWTYNADEHMLELQASAGIHTRIDGSRSRIPVDNTSQVGLIADTCQPYLTNAVMDDPLFFDRAWIKREALVAFAGYPLVVGDRLVGVMAMFAREPLPQATLDGLKSVTDGIALGIKRRWTEELLHSTDDFLEEVMAGFTEAASSEEIDLEDLGKELSMVEWEDEESQMETLPK